MFSDIEGFNKDQYSGLSQENIEYFRPDGIDNFRPWFG